MNLWNMIIQLICGFVNFNKMKTIIKALAISGAIAITFATGYFFLLYEDLQRLIISLGIAGYIILSYIIYTYNWMKMKDEADKETEKSVDMLRDYVREVEKKIK